MESPTVTQKCLRGVFGSGKRKRKQPELSEEEKWKKFQFVFEKTTAPLFFEVGTSKVATSITFQNENWMRTTCVVVER